MVAIYLNMSRPIEIMIDSEEFWGNLSWYSKLSSHIVTKVCGGFLFAAGASRQRHRWKLSKRCLRAKDWIKEA